MTIKCLYKYFLNLQNDKFHSPYKYIYEFICLQRIYNMSPYNMSLYLSTHINTTNIPSFKRQNNSTEQTKEKSVVLKKII